MLSNTQKNRKFKVEASSEQLVASVFSNAREVVAPTVTLPDGLELNTRLQMDGLKLLSALDEEVSPVVFFDPQYRGVLDKLNYGNEGKNRGKARASLEQMDDKKIGAFVKAIDRVLIPSGHLFLWTDKYHLCTDFSGWMNGTNLDVVDMITWNKSKMGMGYRSRRCSEHLLVLQKLPRRAKGVWKIHNIPDVWTEKAPKGTHAKPLDLQAELIESTSNPNDLIIDPCAGTFTVMEASAMRGRNFLGCDLNG